MTKRVRGGEIKSCNFAICEGRAECRLLLRQFVSRTT